MTLFNHLTNICTMARPHKLTRTQVRHIIEKYHEQNITAAELARRYKVSIKTIQRHVNQKPGSQSPIKPKTRQLKKAKPVKEYGFNHKLNCWNVYTTKSTWKNREYSQAELDELLGRNQLGDPSDEDRLWRANAVYLVRKQKELLRPYKAIWQWIRRRAPRDGNETPLEALDRLVEAYEGGGWPITKEVFPEWDDEDGKHGPGTVTQKKRRAKESIELWWRQEQRGATHWPEQVVVGRRSLSRCAEAAAMEWKELLSSDDDVVTRLLGTEPGRRVQRAGSNVLTTENLENASCMDVNPDGD